MDAPAPDPSSALPIPPPHSAALLFAILESLPFRVHVCDPQGRCILQNQVSVRDFGNFLGRQAIDAPLPADVIQRWLAHKREALTGTVSWLEEDVPFHGELRHYRFIIAPIREGDEVRGAVGVDIDMTELRRAQQALAESEARLRVVTEHAPDIIVQVARNCTIQYINRVVPPRTVADIVGTRVDEWASPPYQRLVCESVEHAFERAAPFEYLAEGTAQRGTGLAWYSARVNPVVVDGEVRSVIMIVRDVTEQQRAEVALRDSELRYRLLAENATDVIARHGPSGQWLYVSPACKAVLGYEPGELIGQDSFSFLHPDDRQRVAGLLEEMRRTGRPSSATFRFRRADGRYAWLDVAGRAVQDPATGQLMEIVTTARDVTERIETSEKLRTREADLAHLDRLGTMGQMASELAHELNQPLYAIANFADACQTLLEQPAEVNREELQKWLGQISQQARRAGEVVRRISHFVRKGELHEGPLDLNRCIRDVVAMLDFELRRHNVELQLDLTPDLPLILADELLLEQVLVNLIRNAQEAMEGTPIGSRRLVIRSFQEDSSRVGAAVVDSGPGFKDQGLEHLFDSYYTTKAQGTGMGLAICRSTIEAHRGRIWAANNPHGGATFQFVIPALAP
jgi:two-component system sensor kinase FixL